MFLIAIFNLEEKPGRDALCGRVETFGRTPCAPGMSGILPYFYFSCTEVCDFK